MTINDCISCQCNLQLQWILIKKRIISVLATHNLNTLLKWSKNVVLENSTHQGSTLFIFKLASLRTYVCKYIMKKNTCGWRDYIPAWVCWFTIFKYFSTKLRRLIFLFQIFHYNFRITITEKELHWSQEKLLCQPVFFTWVIVIGKNNQSKCFPMLLQCRKKIPRLALSNPFL